jgi:hypothetical protein
MVTLSGLDATRAPGPQGPATTAGALGYKLFQFEKASGLGRKGIGRDLSYKLSQTAQLAVAGDR